jgi:hypothetical protein
LALPWRVSVGGPCGGAVLEFLAEFERMLILLGAGTEEDAELGMPLIPLPPEMPPGPTVHLEL